MNYVWAIVVIVLAAIVLGVWMVLGTIRSYRQRVTTGKEAMVGTVAVTVTELGPRGLVAIEGERWQAISDDSRIGVGEEVIVTGVDGLRLKVARKSGQGGQK